MSNNCNYTHANWIELVNKFYDVTPYSEYITEISNIHLVKLLNSFVEELASAQTTKESLEYSVDTYYVKNLIVHLPNFVFDVISKILNNILVMYEEYELELITLARGICNNENINNHVHGLLENSDFVNRLKP